MFKVEKNISVKKDEWNVTARVFWMKKIEVVKLPLKFHGFLNSIFKVCCTAGDFPGLFNGDLGNPFLVGFNLVLLGVDFHNDLLVLEFLVDCHLNGQFLLFSACF